MDKQQLAFPHGMRDIPDNIYQLPVSHIGERAAISRNGRNIWLAAEKRVALYIGYVLYDYIVFGHSYHFLTDIHEAGEGYNDIVLMYNAKHIGIIIEVKYAENDNLETECADALKQIEKLHYVDALSEFEVTKVYKYAIACYRKHCMVTMTEENWKK